MSVTQTRNALAAAVAMAPQAAGGSSSSAPELPAQAGQAGKFLTTDGSNPAWDTPAGSGDMTKAVYDTGNVETDIFDYADTAEADAVTAANAYTDSEIAALTIDGLLPSQTGHTGEYLSTDGVNALWAAVLGGTGAVPIGVQLFTGDGTYTPTSGTTHAVILGVGAGGGSGGVGTASGAVMGGSGGMGEVRLGAFPITDPSYPVILGAGGPGGGTAANGTAGASSEITGLMVCNGGDAGLGSNAINTQVAQSADGTGGSGGISLNVLFALGHSIPSLSSNISVDKVPPGGHPYPKLMSTQQGGVTGIGYGQGGVGPHKPSGASGLLGAAGRSGYFLIIEFGS